MKILVLTDFSSSYSRRLLKGILRYSREVGPWSFQRMPLSYRVIYGEEGVVAFARKWKADAIIAQFRDLNIKLLNSLHIPIIVQNYRERNKAVSNLTGNYHETGVMAARFFLNKAYRNFAFYGNQNTIWSRERCGGYCEEIERNGYTCHVLENKNPDSREWFYDHETLGKCLLALPKPVALFACDDSYAFQISETCNVFNITIPDEISLLGVDNDELLCNISNPPLSSIVLDVENGGYQAGKLLHKLVNKEIQESFNIVVEPLYIEKRTSTEKYAVSDKHIQSILSYIDDNYMNHISVDTLVGRVPLSRRLLEKKFRQIMGTSLYQCIQDRRMNQFIRLLLTSDCTMYEAAMQSGFDSYKNVSRIFRKYQSVSPAAYRKLYKINSNDADIEF
jgi:LacI family transcriptional regulator